MSKSPNGGSMGNDDASQERRKTPNDFLKTIGFYGILFAAVGTLITYFVTKETIAAANKAAFDARTHAGVLEEQLKDLDPKVKALQNLKLEDAQAVVNLIDRNKDGGLRTVVDHIVQGKVFERLEEQQRVVAALTTAQEQQAQSIERTEGQMNALTSELAELRASMSKWDQNNGKRLDTLAVSCNAVTVWVGPDSELEKRPEPRVNNVTYDSNKKVQEISGPVPVPEKMEVLQAWALPYDDIQNLVGIHAIRVMPDKKAVKLVVGFQPETPEGHHRIQVVVYLLLRPAT